MEGSGDDRAGHPLLGLESDDLEFVLRFVLASGSLKDLARVYGVSYPTIRSRLDRVIGRLRVFLEGRTPDPMAEELAGLVERGQVTSQAARRLLELHRRRLKEAEGRDR